MTLYSRTGTLLLMTVPLSCFGCGGDGVIALLSSQAHGGEDVERGGAGAAGNGAGGVGGSADSPYWRRSCSEAGDPGCLPEARYCQGTTGLCAECVDGTDCWMSESALKECDPLMGRCVECRTDTDCFASDQFCDVGRNKCVQCVDDSPCTAPATACNRERGECAGPCASADDCSPLLEPHCELSLGLCVECLTDSDCLGGQACTTQSHECV